MTDLTSAITIIREVAESDDIGLSKLAAEAGVPYTTVKSFADRGWTNKNLEVLEKLLGAAGRLKESRVAA